MKHLDPTLKENVFYKSLIVMPMVNDMDGAKVIRIIILYNRNCSFDGFFEKMYLPYTLCDLLELQGELKTNIDLVGLAQTALSVTLDLMFAGGLYIANTFEACDKNIFNRNEFYHNSTIL